jgi:HAD superfamily hydrolase (TIGR01509 family)
MGFMPVPAACLFDLDGLLLDTEPLHSEAWQQAAHHFGLGLTVEQLLALRGRRRFDCAEQVRQWIGEAGQVVPSVDALLAVRQPIAERLLPSAQPMPGAVALIAACQARGVPMAMVTSSSRAAVALKEAPHPWLAAITVRVHGDDPALAAGKPAPDPYLLAARRLGVDPSDCWAFEDSQAGVQAADSAGCLVYVLVHRHDRVAADLVLQWPSSCRLVEDLSEVLLAD